MYTPYLNYYINPAAPFTYQDLRQLREHQATDRAMCHYTVKFFECDHKTDDNVKGCSTWKNTGTHCDIDNPSVRKREDCSIRSEKVDGLCPRCLSRERIRVLRDEEEQRERIEREREEELLRKDLEKARLADQEEQRRNAEAHEAHLKRIKDEEEASWRMRNETKDLDTARDISRVSSLRLESLQCQSRVDMHHRTWTDQSQSNAGGPDVKIRASFWVDKMHRTGPSSSYGDDTCPLHSDSATPKSSIDFHGLNSLSARSATSTSPHFRPGAVSGELADNPDIFQTQTVAFSKHSPTDIYCSPCPTTPALSKFSQCTIDTNILLQKANNLAKTPTRTVIPETTAKSTRQELTPPPSPPSIPRRSSPPWQSTPSFPPVDYSQPPKEQTYDRFMIGGRRQPVHSSQKLASEHPLSPTAPAIPRPRAPQPTVRFAGGITPPVPSSPSSIHSFVSSSTGAQRPRTQRLSRTVSQEETVNELQALWDKKGIKRETEEDENDDTVSASISPSESISQAGGGKPGLYRNYD